MFFTPLFVFHSLYVAVAPQRIIVPFFFIQGISYSKIYSPTLSQYKSTPSEAIYFNFFVIFQFLQLIQTLHPNASIFLHLKSEPAIPMTFQKPKCFKNCTKLSPTPPAAEEITICIFLGKGMIYYFKERYAVRPVGPQIDKYRCIILYSSKRGIFGKAIFSLTIHSQVHQRTPTIYYPILNFFDFVSDTTPTANAGIASFNFIYGRQDLAPEIQTLMTGSILTNLILIRTYLSGSDFDYSQIS